MHKTLTSCRSHGVFASHIFRTFTTGARDACQSDKLQNVANRLREKTPIGKLDELEGKHPFQEKEPLPPFPDGINPKTGEVGGPRGPEPTRYGDWERKGRVAFLERDPKPRILQLFTYLTAINGVAFLQNYKGQFQPTRFT